MKNSVSFLFLILVAMFQATSCNRAGQPTAGGVSDKDTAAIDTTAHLVMQISRQAKLYTSVCQVHKVVLYSDDKHLGGRIFGQDVDFKVSMGDRKVAIPIDVTLKGAVDFSHFGPENVEHMDSMLLITLPDPEITLTASTIDHKGVRQYVGLARSKFGVDEITKLARQGEDSIVAHINRYGIMERTRQSMARQLLPVLKTMGFDEQHVIIRFRKNFADSELQRFVHLDRTTT